MRRQVERLLRDAGLLRIPMRDYESRTNGTPEDTPSGLRIPMRDYEPAQAGLGAYYQELRIPMRDYEVKALEYDEDKHYVTNSHAGL